MTTSSTTPDMPATLGDVNALAADMDIFWLLFGAILVFCECVSRGCCPCLELIPVGSMWGPALKKRGRKRERRKKRRGQEGMCVMYTVAPASTLRFRCGTKSQDTQHASVGGPQQQQQRPPTRVDDKNNLAPKLTLCSLMKQTGGSTLSASRASRT